MRSKSLTFNVSLTFFSHTIVFMWFNEIIKLTLQWNVIKMLSTTRNIMRKFFSTPFFILSLLCEKIHVHFNWLIVLDIPLKSQPKIGSCRLHWNKKRFNFKIEFLYKLTKTICITMSFLMENLLWKFTQISILLKSFFVCISKCNLLT